MLLSNRLNVSSMVPDENLIINGNFDITDHIPATGITNVSNTDYICDRWMHEIYNNLASTINYENDVPSISPGPDGANSSNNSLEIHPYLANLPGGNSYVMLTQRIEGYNFRPAWSIGSGTLSFWAKTNKPGIYCVAFRNYGGISPDRSFVHEFTINLADTWEKKSVTISFDDVVGGIWNFGKQIGLSISFNLSQFTTSEFVTTTPEQWLDGNFIYTSNQTDCRNSTSEYFRLSQVKFEPGSEVRPFVLYDMTAEIQKCRRYFEKIDMYHHIWASSHTTNFWNYYKWKSIKRVTPSIITYPGSSVWTQGTEKVVGDGSGLDYGNFAPVPGRHGMIFHIGGHSLPGVASASSHVGSVYFGGDAEL